MTELPDELRRLIERDERPVQEHERGVGEQLVSEVAQLLFPLLPHEPPRVTDARNDFLQSSRRRLSRGTYVGGDDVLLDQLRHLRQQQDEAARRTRVLLAYARTVPPPGRKYRLRDLSEASGLPISSIRDRITATELQAIDKLELDSERASWLGQKLTEAEDE